MRINNDMLFLGLLMSFAGLWVANLIQHYVIEMAGMLLIVFGTWIISRSINEEGKKE